MLFCVVEDQGSMECFLVHLLWPAAASSSDLHGAVVVVACYRFYRMVVVSPTWAKLVGKCNLAWTPRSHSDLEWEFSVFKGRYYCIHCWCCHWTVSNERKAITVHSSAKNKRQKTNFVSSAYINLSSIFFLCFLDKTPVCESKLSLCCVPSVVGVTYFQPYLVYMACGGASAPLIQASELSKEPNPQWHQCSLFWY